MSYLYFPPDGNLTFISYWVFRAVMKRVPVCQPRWRMAVHSEMNFKGKRWITLGFFFLLVMARTGARNSCRVHEQNKVININ